MKARNSKNFYFQSYKIYNKLLILFMLVLINSNFIVTFLIKTIYALLTIFVNKLTNIYI